MITGKRYIYKFGNKDTDGDRSMASLLGGKGANLAEMSKCGIPVPPGFTISTDAYLAYIENNFSIPEEIVSQIDNAIDELQDSMGQQFANDANNPMLLSVRSGAVVSMPGMMDTILNLGINDNTVESLAKKFNNKVFAYDSYRRFIQMYGSVVCAIPQYEFDNAMIKVRKDNDLSSGQVLSIDHMMKVITSFKEVIRQKKNVEMTQDIRAQLLSSIEAVFKSWMNDRALSYRALHDISDSLGTAVTVQYMVFGNFNDDSATGVLFTRNPSTGQKMLYGEYLPKAQGEDIVAGTHTPYPILSESAEGNSLESCMPSVFGELCDIANTLEHYYKDVQDIEFTIENGKLFILQTRNAKRTPSAAIKMAVDMVNEGLISKEDALLSINPSQISVLLHPTVDYSYNKVLLAKGLPASPGAVSGIVVFTPEEAKLCKKNGVNAILVREETTPDDIDGMVASVGFITVRGGMTSHAAVVARGMGKPCICGVSSMKINIDERVLLIGDHIIKYGEYVTLDGTTGEVMLGEMPAKSAELSLEFHTLMSWAREIKKLQVRVNADTVSDCIIARKFSAEGIGLCRTEHMFFAKERILQVRKIILSLTAEERERALKEVLLMQKGDFLEIFQKFPGMPVNIRLLDPPLHEFLPNITNGEVIDELATELGITKELLHNRINMLHEVNPMLGHRGCRVGISHPEIYQMQIRAIFMAISELCQASKAEFKTPIVEIMVPFVSIDTELVSIKRDIELIAQEISRNYRVNLQFCIGCMLELPRAAMTADKIAEQVSFFCFGTNDLTQTVFGISRDDAGKFIEVYSRNGIIAKDPFVSIDREGVGEMMKYTLEKARIKSPNIKLGICGEHGGDPESIDFFHSIGLHYISCSPYRLPIAILTAAQAVIKENRNV